MTAYGMRISDWSSDVCSSDLWSAGGEGIERDLLMLEDVTVSLITERRVSPPWGLAGGGPGAVGENWLLPGGDEDRAERPPDKITLRLHAGDVLPMLTPGGGEFGGASCRARVCQYGYVSVGAVSHKQK